MKDTIQNEHSGKFIDWHLKLWGECIDESKAQLLPFPTDHDDDDHDQILTTTTASATQTSVDATQPTEPLLGNPTDHPDRPVNAKPTDTSDEVTQPSDTSEEATATPSSWLPSFFPTFGVSAKTQIWIYGSIALIVIFMSGLGVYFYMARRRRLRNNPRDDYEFELLDDEETRGLTDGNGVPNGAGNAGGKLGKGKRRAGELYDAFAAGSEDESEGEYSDGKEEQHVIGDPDDFEDSDEEMEENEKTGERRKTHD